MEVDVVSVVGLGYVGLLYGFMPFYLSWKAKWFYAILSFLES